MLPVLYRARLPPSCGSRPSASAARWTAFVSCLRSRSDLQKISADDNRAMEVLAGRVDPHLVRHGRIVRWHEVGEHQELDSGCLRDAAGIVRGGVMRGDA